MKELKIIKETILKIAEKYGIKIEKIILFGSRARGDWKEGSDWDILIVTREKLEKKVEDEFWLEIGRELVKAEIIPEIIVSSKEELKKYSKYYGFIHYHALRKGVVIR